MKEDELKNKIGISSGTLAGLSLPFERKLLLMENAGFRTIELCHGEDTNYLKRSEVKKIKDILSKEKIIIRAIHAPCQYQLSSLSKGEQKKAIDEIRGTFDAAVELGAKIVVFHPHEGSEWVTRLELEEEARITMLKKGISMLLKYIPSGINLALENGDSLKMMKEVFTEFPKESLGFCFDSAHAAHTEITGVPLCKFLEKFGERLIHTHISDMNIKGQDHILPFEGVIAWEEVMGMLSRIAYKSLLLLELNISSSSYIPSPEIYLAEAWHRGRKLVELQKRIEENIFSQF